MLGKRIGFAICNISLTAKDLEVEIENLVQFSVPVVHQTGRHNHQGTLEFTTAGEFTQHEGGLDGFTETDFIGDQVATGGGGSNSMRKDNLMWKQINLGRCQSGSTVEQWECVALVRQPRTLIPFFAMTDQLQAARSRPSARPSRRASRSFLP